MQGKINVEAAKITHFTVSVQGGHVQCMFSYHVIFGELTCKVYNLRETWTILLHPLCVKLICACIDFLNSQTKDFFAKSETTFKILVSCDFVI